MAQKKAQNGSKKLEKVQNRLKTRNGSKKTGNGAKKPQKTVVSRKYLKEPPEKTAFDWFKNTNEIVPRPIYFKIINS